jgi:UPF0716 protein FxsA
LVEAAIPEMPMFGRLLLLSFLAVPLIEIAGFVLVGQAIGLVPTLLGVLIAAVAGAFIIRWQGVALLRDLQATLSRGQLPARKLADAMLVGLAGLLLLLPGYFTDLVGVLLLIPPVRSLIYQQLARRMTVVSAPRQPPSDPSLIELDDDDWRER